MQSQSPQRRLIPLGAALFSLLLFAPAAARAGDSTPPVITHTPAHSTVGQPIHVMAHIVDESRIFPQLFFRYGSAGSYEAPSDLKKMKGAKDDYEATIPYKSGPVDYYIECYDEFGNGPARAGSPDAPLVVVSDAAVAASATADVPLPSPSTASGAAAPVATSAPAPAADASSRPASASASTARPNAPADLKSSVNLRLEPAAPLTANQAAWHSLILPGWGQYRSERRIRGLAFGVATGASLVATLWLTVRAHQANTIYVNAPVSVRSQAYDQAVNYADARNTMLGVTIGLWAVNVAEAYLLHGTKDPW